MVKFLSWLIGIILLVLTGTGTYWWNTGKIPFVGPVTVGEQPRQAEVQQEQTRSAPVQAQSQPVVQEPQVQMIPGQSAHIIIRDNFKPDKDPENKYGACIPNSNVPMQQESLQSLVDDWARKIEKGMPRHTITYTGYVPCETRQNVGW